MKALINIIDPPAPGLNKSYGHLEYGNYGVCVWEYADDSLGAGGQPHKGAIEWINFPEFITYPKYPHPIAFHYWFHVGVHAHVSVVPEIRTDVADAVLQGIAVNLLVGRGLALLAP